MTEPSILGNSLFLVGEIGGNDYNHPFFQNQRVEEIRTFVPSVVEAISSAITVSLLVPPDPLSRTCNHADMSFTPMRFYFWMIGFDQTRCKKIGGSRKSTHRMCSSVSDAVPDPKA